MCERRLTLSQKHQQEKKLMGMQKVLNEVFCSCVKQVHDILGTLIHFKGDSAIGSRLNVWREFIVICRS